MIEDCSSPDRGCSARVGTEVLLEFLECHELASEWALGSPLLLLPYPMPCAQVKEGPTGTLGSWVLLQSPSAGPELGPTVICSPGHSWPCSTAASAMLCCVILTEPHAWCDGDEGHDATEAAIDGEQCFVEEAGSWVGVELVEEGEGGRGEGVEGSRGQQHGQIPALVLCSTCQPVEEWVSGGSGQVPTRYPSTYQFLFQVCAKAVISTSWMRMKAKPPQTPV